MYDIVSANIVHVYTDSFNDRESRLFQAIYTRSGVVRTQVYSEPQAL